MEKEELVFDKKVVEEHFRQLTDMLRGLGFQFKVSGYAVDITYDEDTVIVYSAVSSAWHYLNNGVPSYQMYGYSTLVRALKDRREETTGELEYAYKVIKEAVDLSTVTVKEILTESGLLTKPDVPQFVFETYKLFTDACYDVSFASFVRWLVTNQGAGTSEDEMKETFKYMFENAFFTDNRVNCEKVERYFYFN